MKKEIAWILVFKCFQVNRLMAYFHLSRDFCCSPPDQHVRNVATVLPIPSIFPGVTFLGPPFPNAPFTLASRTLLCTLSRIRPRTGSRRDLETDWFSTVSSSKHSQFVSKILQRHRDHLEAGRIRLHDNRQWGVLSVLVLGTVYRLDYN